MKTTYYEIQNLNGVVFTSPDAKEIRECWKKMVKQPDRSGANHTLKLVTVLEVSREGE